MLRTGATKVARRTGKAQSSVVAVCETEHSKELRRKWTGMQGVLYENEDDMYVIICFGVEKVREWFSVNNSAK